MNTVILNSLHISNLYILDTSNVSVKEVFSAIAETNYNGGTNLTKFCNFLCLGLKYFYFIFIFTFLITL